MKHNIYNTQKHDQRAELDQIHTKEETPVEYSLSQNLTIRLTIRITEIIFTYDSNNRNKHPRIAMEERREAGERKENRRRQKGCEVRAYSAGSRVPSWVGPGPS